MAKRGTKFYYALKKTFECRECGEKRMHEVHHCRKDKIKRASTDTPICLMHWLHADRDADLKMVPAGEDEVQLVGPLGKAVPGDQVNNQAFVLYENEPDRLTI